MVEMIFILLTAYVAYVVYTASSSDEKNQAVSAKPKPLVPEVKVVAKKAEKTTVKKKAVEKKVIKTAVKPVAKKAATAATATKMPGGSVRNPETGEVDKMANSYQMCKRWIKEALVAEGFLDKIYKSSEIDATARGEINQALEKLIAMESYAA